MVRWWLEEEIVQGIVGSPSVGSCARFGLRAGQAGGLLAVLVAGLEAAVADILHHRAGKEVRALQHHAERTAQVRLFDFIDIDDTIAELGGMDVLKYDTRMRKAIEVLKDNN